jgi:hypothetical protein
MNSAIGSKVRGSIIKVPDSNPGLLFVNSEQKPFSIEGIWKSSVAPAVNMAVDVEFDGSGSIRAVTVVDPQQLAKERLTDVSGKAQEQGKQIFEIIRQAIGALAARMGSIALGTTVAVWIAWFFLTAAKLDLGFLGSKSFTFWELLALDLSNPMNMGSGSHGLFALIGLAAIAAPFAAPFIRHAQANYLNAMPLAYLVMAFLKIRSDLKEMFEVMKFGPGTYVLFIAGLVLAVHAYKSRAKT